LLYFGGYSPDGVELCAEHCDVYLMWPETEAKIQTLMDNVGAAAGAKFGRTIDFGLRVHVIVRETEAEAIAASQSLMQNIDAEAAEELKNRALDAKSYGVSRQAELRQGADKDGFAEDHLWTGIGRARSGCGAAIVGNPDQVYEKLMRYHAMGIRSFILSGYPHLEECELFAHYVLPRLKTCSLPEVLGRRPVGIPDSPLGGGVRY
jgi:alkanesulfonate monooxygenase